MDEILGPFGEALAKQIAKELARELRSANDDWKSQHSEGLPWGPKVHCAIVRRRSERGLPDAVIDGKRFLLSREAILEEMRSRALARPLAKAAPSRAAAPEAEPPTGVRARIMKKLGRA